MSIQQLETSPDTWFNSPSGWLYKPNYKRDAQLKSNVVAQTITHSKPFSFKRLVTGSPYNKRWFRLDMKNRVLSYYSSQFDEEMAGQVDLCTILEIQYGQVHDAPDFSLDLISSDRHYTIAAESHASMVKWAYALKLALNKSSNISKNVTAPTNVLSNEEKWLRYDFTYELPGPLYLNVMGTSHRDRVGKILKNWIVVISFEADAEGRPGRSETSGVISVGDYLVGYNGLDLTEYTFNDAVEGEIVIR